MDGFFENADSWRSLLKGLKRRGLKLSPELGTGPINLCFQVNGDSECQRSFTMSYLFWLSEAQMSKIDPFFPLAHGAASC